MHDDQLYFVVLKTQLVEYADLSGRPTNVQGHSFGIMFSPQALLELVMRALGPLVDQKHHNRHREERPGDLGEVISKKAWLNHRTALWMSIIKMDVRPSCKMSLSDIENINTEVDYSQSDLLQHFMGCGSIVYGC